MNRIYILKESLRKKENNFFGKLDELYKDVKRTNGQPLNDKKGGDKTFKRWGKYNSQLEKIENEIERTKEAIEREESKNKLVEKEKNNFPNPILTLINEGVLKQWRKYPHILFVEGVEKGRIIWDKDKKLVFHKFFSQIKDVEGKRKFMQIYNYLNKKINEDGIQ